MHNRLILSALFLLLLSLPLAAADLTGKWTGYGELAMNNGETRSVGFYMDLVHKGDDITGNAGPDAEQALPIRKAQLKGDELTFEVVGPPDMDYGLFTFHFKVSGDKMQGTVKCDRFTGKLTAKRGS